MNAKKSEGQEMEASSSAPATAVHAFFHSTVASVFDATIFAYDEATAAWLTEVTDAPHDTELNHLSGSILRDGTQPLGILSRGFVRLFAELFHAELVAEPTEALQTLSLAASTFRLGAARLLALVLDVLPPLRAVAAARVAEAIEAALFDEGIAGTLQPLLRVGSGAHDEAFGARIDALADAPDASTMLCERLGLAPSLLESISPAVHAARSMACCASPHAKLRRFLAVCVSHGDSCSADELIPACAAALILGRQRTLPSALLLLDLFVCDEGELLGPLGYGLATLHAATSLIELEGGYAHDDGEGEGEGCGGGGQLLVAAILPNTRGCLTSGTHEHAHERPSGFMPTRPPIRACDSPSAASPPPPPPASPAVIVRENVALAAEHGARWLDSLATAALSPTKAGRRSPWGAKAESAALGWQHAPSPMRLPQPVRRSLDWPEDEEPAVGPPSATPPAVIIDGRAATTDGTLAAQAVAAVTANEDDEACAPASPAPSHRLLPPQSPGLSPASGALGIATSRAGSPARRHRKQRLAAGAPAPAHTDASARIESNAPALAPSAAGAAAAAASPRAASPSPRIARASSPRARSPRWASPRGVSPRGSPAGALTPHSPGEANHLLGATPPTERRRRRKQRCSSGAATNRTVEALEVPECFNSEK